MGTTFSKLCNDHNTRSCFYIATLAVTSVWHVFRALQFAGQPKKTLNLVSMPGLYVTLLYHSTIRDSFELRFDCIFSFHVGSLQSRANQWLISCASTAGPTLHSLSILPCDSSEKLTTTERQQREPSWRLG